MCTLHMLSHEAQSHTFPTHRHHTSPQTRAHLSCHWLACQDRFTAQVAVLAAALAVAPLLPGLRRDGGAGLSAASLCRRQLAVCGAHTWAY